MHGFISLPDARSCDKNNSTAYTECDISILLFKLQGSVQNMKPVQRQSVPLPFGWRHNQIDKMQQIYQCTLYENTPTTAVPTKSDRSVIFCLQLLSKILTCTLHLSLRESIDHFCINPILWIGLIHK